MAVSHVAASHVAVSYVAVSYVAVSYLAVPMWRYLATGVDREQGAAIAYAFFCYNRGLLCD